MTTPWNKLEAFENKYGDWYHLLNEYVQAKYRTPENPKKAIEYDKLLKNHDKIIRDCVMFMFGMKYQKSLSKESCEE